ncbi:MAG: restriction endonuclease subunit S, partial [Methylomicrobium sp.]|nr:restriction endonuclease subunit S [Methylomicrobium sp.]
MSYSSYSDYKDSGVAWIGQIPSHWTKARLKFLCKVQTGNRDTVHASPDGAYPFFIRSPKVSRIDSFSFDCEAILTPGDGDVGNIFHHVNGKFDFHQRVYMMNQFKKVYPRFFYYYMRGMFICVAKDGSAKTTVDSLRLPTLHNFWFALPKIQEQESIANFLDRETARIDKLIAEKQNFIKLLKEKRQALISHVVTKGLNSNVKMKDTGIEWIGEVPEHWELIKFSHFVSIRNGQVDPTEEPWNNFILIAPNHVESSSGRILKKETASE